MLQSSDMKRDYAQHAHQDAALRWGVTESPAVKDVLPEPVAENNRPMTSRWAALAVAATAKNSSNIYYMIRIRRFFL